MAIRLKNLTPDELEKLDWAQKPGAKFTGEEMISVLRALSKARKPDMVQARIRKALDKGDNVCLRCGENLRCGAHCYTCEPYVSD